MDTEIGQNQHYRRDCYQDPCPLAERVVRDDRVWTHLDSVIALYSYRTRKEITSVIFKGTIQGHDKRMK